MKFSCNQQALSRALNIVSKAVTARTTVPILKGILIKVDEDGYLTMAASDLDISIEKKIKVDESEAGEIVVQAKLFGDIIRKLPNSKVEIIESNGNITILCSSSQFNIVGISSDEFPVLNKEEISEKIILNKEVLKSLIKKTSFAASIDEARGIITGILIEIKKDSLTMVALDGFRMAVAKESIQNNDEKSIVISAKILNEISKIISENEYEDENKEDIEILVNDKKAVFVMENTRVILRLLEGEFVRYRDILPKESSTEVVINKNDLLDSIERASLLAKVGKNNLIKLDIREDNVEITSKSEEGNVKEDLLISKSGNDLVIGFNSKYLIDSLKNIEDEEIKILLNSSVSPCLIKPLEEGSFEYLILPVRITNN